MAITDTQKVDYLWKKLGYAATKTDTNANKKAPNEAIASPLQLRADKVMTQSASIPGTQPASSSGVAFVYPTSAPIETTNDGTASANRTWKTGVTDWISPEFGSTYQVKVYIHTSGDASNAASGGTQVGATGSGNNDEWFFDYQSGVLHFIGTNLPNGVSFSGKSVYIAGARYVGTFGVDNNGAFTFTDNRIQTTSTNEEIILDPAGTGKVVIDSDLNLDSNQIINVADPTSNQHAATKAYVDSQVTAQDLDFQGDSGGALNIDLDSETLTIAGGSGIDTSGSSNTLTVAIDNTVVTLTGSQTLTNKILTTPTLTTPVANAGIQLKNGATSAGFLEFFEDSDNGTNKVTLIGPASTADVTLTLPAATDTLVGKATTDTLTNKTLTTPIIAQISNTGTITLPTSTDTLIGRATTDTLTNKTIDANGTGNSISNLEVADFASGVLDTDLSSVAGTDTTLASAKAIKTYVDAQITAQDLDFEADSGGALAIDLDSETLTFTGGTGIDTSGSGNAVTFAIDSTVTTLTGSQTLTNKTLTTPIITTPVVNAGLQLKNGATSAGFLEFFEDSDNGTNKVTLIGPASTADVTVTLPAAADTLVGKATTDTLTNKTIDSANNTLTLDLSEGTLVGTTAEFNSALSDDSFATLTNSVTLTNKTLTNPTINAFSGTGNGSITGTLAITNTTTSDSLTITTTEDSSTAGPVISLKRNSSSPADADYIGQIKFQGENDADQEVLYAKITGKIGDMTDGTEDGIIEIAHRKAGSNNISARFSSTKLMLINDTGLEVAGAVTFSSALAMSSQQITGLADPTSNQHAATKAYVDSQTSALDLTLGIGADSGSDSTVATSQTLTISGTSNEIETSVSGQEITIGLPDDVTIGSDLTVTGNLTVNGTTTTLATNNSTVEDSLIELNNGATSNSNDLGFIFERGSTGNNAAIIWDESADKFVLGTTTATGASTGNLTVATGTLVANIEGNVTGAVTGNADTATALATARNIGGVSFDGTGDINLPGVNTGGNQDTSGNAATATALETARNIGGVSFNGTGDINLPGVNQAGNQNTSGTAAIATTVTVTDNEATNENNVILFGAGAAGSGNIGVEADGNMTYNPSTGKITATGFIGALTGDASGNAGTATALETARNIAGQSFDGTGDITIASGDLSNSSAITLNTAAQTLTNKSLTAPILTGSSSAAGSILFKEDTDNGTNAVTLIGPASTADVTITLPASAGTVALTSDIPSAGISSGNVATFTSGAVDNDFLRIDGTAIEGRSASEVLSDIGGQAALTFGIANTNAVKIDSADVADDEFARFTANGLEGRSTTEVLGDLGLATSDSPQFTAINLGHASDTTIARSSAGVATIEGVEITTNSATQTLTNKTLTTPTITTPVVNAGMDLKNGATSAGFVKFFEDSDNGTNAVTLIGPASTADVTLTLPAATDTLIGKATTDTLTNKTFDANGTGNSLSNVEVADFAASAIVTESEGLASSDNDTSLPTTAAVKDYVDTQITAEDLDITTDSGTIAIDLDSETLTVAGGTGLDSSATGNTVTLAIDSTVATLAGSQTLTNKTITAPTISAPVISATSTTVGGKIKLLEGTDNGTNGVTLVGAASTADVDIIFPATAGTVALVASSLQLSGGTMSGAIAMGTSKITGMGDPTANQDAATKAYVDSTVSSGSTLITQGNSNVTVADSGTGNVTIEVDGTDRITTVAATTTTATGHSIVLGAASNSAAGSIKFLEGTDNGTNGVTLQGPASTADVTVTLPASADTLVGKATTDTLTNKTINGPDNTLTNIANGSLANSTITVARQGGNSTAVALGGTITFNNVANETTVAESSGTVTIGLADDVTIPNLTVSQDAVVTGNLTVNGTTTTLATTNSVVEDSIIELNTGATSNSNDLGFIFERGSTGNNAAFIWDESADKFTLGTTTSTGAATGNITVSSGTLVAALEGNATTATTLATARNIAGQSFDGSAAITIASTDLSDTSSITLNAATQTLTNKTLGATTVAGHIIPDSDSAYDLGSSSVKFRDLYLSGSSLNLDAFSIETHANGITFNHSSNTTLLPVGGGAHTVVTLAGTETLTNKTLTNPTINAFTGTGNGTITGNLTVSANVDADNVTTDGLKIVDNNVMSTRSNDNINLIPSGTGKVNIAGLLFPITDGSDGHVLKTDGAGNLSFAAESGSTAGHTIQNAGSNLTQRAGLNFDGTHIIATDDSGNGQTDITISSTLQTIAGKTFPSGAIVGSSDSQTLTNKILTTPTITTPVVNAGLQLKNGATSAGFIEFFEDSDNGTNKLTLIGPGSTADATLTLPSATDTMVARATTDTLTNKTINSNANTLHIDLDDLGTFTGTLAEFNAGLQGDSFVSLTGTETLTNKTLTTPALTTPALTTPTVATNIDLLARAELRFKDADSSHYVGFEAPATISSNLIWVLPATDGSNTQVLTTDGSGNLSWTDGGGGGGASTLGGLNDVTVSSAETNDLIVYTGSGFENKQKHEVAPTVNFTKADGTAQLITLENAYDLTTIAGYMNDRVSQKYKMPFTDSSGSSVSTLIITLDDINGNSATSTLATLATDAVTLQTARTIGGVSFDGSANINLPGVNTAGNQDTSGTAAVATTFTVADEGSDTTCFPTFVTAATGNLGAKTDSVFTYNSSNGTLGATTFSGVATSAQYADLAEMYASDDDIEEGTVVMFAGEGKVVACDRNNCRRVAGIVSTNPAHLMNSTQDGVALALAGRVPCKVIGPVQAGDLMVSAGNGRAMANNDALTGTIIGKAIEDHPDGEGVIEVLSMMM
jgi:preprotein translocase subunit Sec61beta